MVTRRDSPGAKDTLSNPRSDPGYVASNSLDANEVNNLREVLHAIVERNVANKEILRMFVVLRAEATTPGHPAHAHLAQREARIHREVGASVSHLVDAPYEFALETFALMGGLEMMWLLEPYSFDLVEQWDKSFDDLLRARNLL